MQQLLLLPTFVRIVTAAPTRNRTGRPESRHLLGFSIWDVVTTSPPLESQRLGTPDSDIRTLTWLALLFLVKLKIMT